MVQTFIEHAAIICSTFPLRSVTTDFFSSCKFSFNIWKLLYLQLYIADTDVLHQSCAFL